MKANVLLTCCGHKSYLVDFFRKSEHCGTIVAADADPVATIRHAADEFVRAPSLETPDAYVHALLDACTANKVHAVIPQNDLDLVLLASRRDAFAERGAIVMGVDEKIATAVGDKLQASTWLADRGIHTPQTELVGAEPIALAPPIVAKSRFGQGSDGLRICRDALSVSSLPDGVVVQPVLDGIEYNLDVLRDRDHNTVAVVVKQKIEMRSGSTSKALFVRDRALEELGHAIGDALDPVGGIDVDVMVQRDGTASVIDINPRLGGGFPFTANVVPRYVDALLEIAHGESPEPIRTYATGAEVPRTFEYTTLPTDV
jgi:carbamoyl-phosphate synthase large subunit